MLLRVTGFLVLNGGNEFQPGNEPQDRLLIAAAGTGPAFVVPTAAARQAPERAVATGRAWFQGLGLEAEELPVRTRGEAQSSALADRAREAGLLYLVGGDPGYLVRTLRGSRVWDAMAAAWQAGAALAGSSAGAMALCAWSLINAGWPRRGQRRAVPALGLVPGTAVLPHHNAFGKTWTVVDPPAGLLLLGIDERTAAVWEPSGGTWRAIGPGAVTIGEARFTSGQECAGLPPPDAAPPPEP
jgi:cyanophycinase-like exopeptidase